LTFNLKPPGAEGDRYEEFDSEETVIALEAALRAYGHDSVRLGWGEPMLDALDRERVDGVFNFAEGIGGRGRESQVPAMLEMLGIPFTASGPLTIAITLAKPAAEGSSMGITSASLCQDEAQLHAALERLKPYGPVLVEEFLSGDEFTV